MRVFPLFCALSGWSKDEDDGELQWEMENDTVICVCLGGSGDDYLEEGKLNIIFP